MSDFPLRSLLLEQGFSVDICNELTVIGFPDGHDGLLLDAKELAQLRIPELLQLSGRRQRILRAVTVLSDARNISQHVDEPGYISMQQEGAGGTFVSGPALTFWLQREDEPAVLRRFFEGFFFSRPVDESELLQALAAPTSVPIENPPVIARVDATRAKSCLHGSDTPVALGATALQASATRSSLSAHVSAPTVPLAQRLHITLEAARAQILSTHSIWLGASRLWIADTDDWIGTADLVSAAERRLDEWIGQGHAHVLLRFAPDRYREAIRTRLLQATRDLKLELDASDMAIGAHFLADELIAEWVMHTDYERGFLGALAASGNRNALYPAWWTLRHLAMVEMPSAENWLRDFHMLCEHAGWYNLHALLDAPTRSALGSRLQFAMNRLREYGDTWAYLDNVALFALVLGNRTIGAALLQDAFWQDALLYRHSAYRKTPARLAPLKEAVLALSLLVPGADLRRLIERAGESLELAHDGPGIETTALALAIAWYRCDRADEPSTAHSPE